MLSKEDLLAQLTDLLRTHLSPESYSEAPASGLNSGLPMYVPFVRIEPWVFGNDVVTPDGAWELCVESSLYFGKTPVMAYQWYKGWVFRVPMYMLNPEFEAAIEPENHHRFEWSVDLSPKCFALALAEYQKECAAREDQCQIVETVLGVEL